MSNISQNFDEPRVFVTLSLDSIRPCPSQPRRIFEKKALDELAASIRQYGIMQPIVVRKMATGYELIAGERRWRAARLAGLNTIDAIIYEADSEQSAYLSLIENLQRSDLHFFEEAESYLQIMRRYGITQEELAARIGKRQSTVANKLRVNRLSPTVKETVYCGGLTERHARAILKLPDEAAQLAILQKAAEKRLSVAEVERMAERVLTGQPTKPTVTRLFRDYRLFVNTIKNSVNDLKKSGVQADYEVTQEENFVRITVTLPHNLKTGTKGAAGK